MTDDLLDPRTERAAIAHVLSIDPGIDRTGYAIYRLAETDRVPLALDVQYLPYCAARLVVVRSWTTSPADPISERVQALRAYGARSPKHRRARAGSGRAGWCGTRPCCPLLRIVDNRKELYYVGYSSRCPTIAGREANAS
jgi:hypothetical protein